jgi:predicted molibdopterin-dependent oxidoreductase YjgC
MSNALPRLTEPMIRENGALRVATWDEALDMAAKGLKAAVDLKGEQGANNIDSCNRT